MESEDESSASDDQLMPEEAKDRGLSNELVASSVDFPVEGGQVVSWDDDLEYGSVKRPRLSVAVKSGSEIPHDAQSRITPVIQDEMEKFLQSATATYITQNLEPVTLKINNIPGHTLTPLALQSQSSVVSELRSSNQGDISVLGPYVKREVTVETDYNIETSQPEPLPIKESGGGLIVTKKKTLKTTTKEVTTTVKQVYQCFHSSYSVRCSLSQIKTLVIKLFLNLFHGSRLNNKDNFEDQQQLDKYF